MNQKISKNQILNLKLFFDFLQEKEIENYILSNLCEFDENISPNYALKIELISGFSSSNSFLLFSSREQRKKIILITDTRYELSGKIYFDPDELKKESEIDFEIFLISRNKKLDFFEKICFEPKFFNQGIIDLLFLESCEKFLLEENIFEDFSKKICLNYENSQNISEPFLYSEEYSGETSELKIKRFFKEFEGQKMSHYLISDPISICWLFNFRASDVPFTPVFLCFGLVDLSLKKIDIFCQKPELLKKIKIQAKNLAELNDQILKLSLCGGLSMGRNSSFFFSNFKDKDINFFENQAPLLMSKKNNLEIELSKEAHICDGLALCKLFLWLKESEFDENLIAKKLLEFKKESSIIFGLKFFSESFETICGFEKNSAIIHYHSDENQNNPIQKNGILLLDSGSHYFGATTDVTRVFLIKNHKPSIQQIKNYTLCLKSHLYLFLNQFEVGTNFGEISKNIYKILEENGLSCPHSIGHGVSNFLSVHEKPFSINKNSSQKIEENLILSNEPGVYFEGKYGIRIENLILSKKKNDDSFEFDNLTSFFYEPKLIDFNLLSDNETHFIKNFHEQTFFQIKDHLSENERQIIFDHFVAGENFERKLYNLQNLQNDLESYEFSFFDQIDSTQNYLFDLIKIKEHVHGSIVLASSQSKGRGKASNLWESDRGGIYLSFTYDFSNKKFDMKFFPQISLIIGLVICQIIEKNLSYDENLIQIKWPNDILLNGKKICGILPEILMNHLIIGVGINFFPNQNIINDEKRDNISNLVSIEFHRLVFEIVQKTYETLDQFFNSGEFMENFIKFKIIPQIEKRLARNSKLGEILCLKKDGSVDVFDEETNSIKNFKSALDFENHK